MSTKTVAGKYSYCLCLQGKSPYRAGSFVGLDLILKDPALWPGLLDVVSKFFGIKFRA
jgi:hypothetical protein